MKKTTNSSKHIIGNNPHTCGRRPQLIGVALATILSSWQSSPADAARRNCLVAATLDRAQKRIALQVRQRRCRQADRIFDVSLELLGRNLACRTSAVGRRIYFWKGVCLQRANRQAAAAWAWQRALATGPKISLPSGLAPAVVAAFTKVEGTRSPARAPTSRARGTKPQPATSRSSDCPVASQKRLHVLARTVEQAAAANYCSVVFDKLKLVRKIGSVLPACRRHFHYARAYVVWAICAQRAGRTTKAKELARFAGRVAPGIAPPPDLATPTTRHLFGLPPHSASAPKPHAVPHSQTGALAPASQPHDHPHKAHSRQPQSSFPSVSRRYSEGKTLELGAGLGGAYSGSQDAGTRTQQTRFSIAADLKYFVTKTFNLGLTISASMQRSSVQIDGQPEAKSTTSDLLLAGTPGLAFHLGGPSFLYLDFQFGLVRLHSRSAAGKRADIVALVGGEVGLKFTLSRHLLLKVGVRPLYLSGRLNGQPFEAPRVDWLVGLAAYL